MSAPACGLNEHYEGRRKEVAFLRRAYNEIQRQKELASQQQQQLTGCEAPQSKTDRRRSLKPSDHEVGYSYEGLTDEQAKRLKQYETMVNSPRTNESAKLPRRFNNIDYMSQW